jgi:hypothetical protein
MEIRLAISVKIGGKWNDLDTIEDVIYVRSVLVEWLAIIDDVAGRWPLVRHHIGDATKIAAYEELRSMRAVGDRFGITAERVRQIMKRNGVKPTPRVRIVAMKRCERCNTEITGGGRYYCSYACQRAALPVREQDRRECDGCGRPFYRRDTRPRLKNLTRWYCSQRCYHKSQRARRAEVLEG